MGPLGPWELRHGWLPQNQIPLDLVVEYADCFHGAKDVHGETQRLRAPTTGWII